jgi:hypothetical protein
MWMCKIGISDKCPSDSENPSAMPRDFFDPTPEQQNVILIDAATLRKAERLIESCEHCNPEGAEIPFDNILDRVTGSDPSVTDYILEQPAHGYGVPKAKTG